MSRASRRPLLLVALLAAVARLGAASVSFLAHEPWLIPDEGQYLELATTVAQGREADAWTPGYGQALYDSVWVFIAPLSRLFEVFGPSRLTGQLWAAGFGVATAIGAAWLAGRISGRRAAIFAGGAVAVLPSQVLWSSMVLRESLAWFALVLMAVGIAHWYDERRPDLAGHALVAAGVLCLAFLRPQTMLAAAWSAVLVTFLLSRPGRRTKIASSLAIALLVPMVAGFGLGGGELLSGAVPALGTKRTLLSDGAESAFTATTVVGEDAAPRSAPGAEPQSAAEADDRRVVRGTEGDAYLVDDSVAGTLRALPRGAVASLLRPFPWERGDSVALRLASVENLLWYGFYAAAIAGAWFYRRRSDLLAFPIVCSGAILAVAFVSQGNLGTAFRHRGQVFWAIALLASVCVEHVVASRTTGGTKQPAPDPAQVDGA